MEAKAGCLGLLRDTHLSAGALALLLSGVVIYFFVNHIKGEPKLKGNKKFKKKPTPIKGKTAALKIEKALKKVKEKEGHSLHG